MGQIKNIKLHIVTDIQVANRQTDRQIREKMKLLTHNMLTCTIKGVKNGFPFKIEASDVQIREADYHPEFITRMIEKLEWKALVETAHTLGYGNTLSLDMGENKSQFLESEEFLKDLHHVLMEIEIMEGNLVCPETGRKFPITKGIPNMLLKEDEVW